MFSLKAFMYILSIYHIMVLHTFKSHFTLLLHNTGFILFVIVCPKYIRHLTVKSRCWYFNEKRSDVLRYDYRKIKVMKRLNYKIAILHNNITILILILLYCDIVRQYGYLTFKPFDDFEFSIIIY